MRGKIFFRVKKQLHLLILFQTLWTAKGNFKMGVVLTHLLVHMSQVGKVALNHWLIMMRFLRAPFLPLEQAWPTFKRALWKDFRGHFLMLKFLNLNTFLSLFAVLGHVQVGNFFLVFSLHTHHFQGDTIKSRQRFDHVVGERKEIQMNQFFPLNSLPSF